jgi:murein DD-endopeptidase MepM/ murein hydrolase activator NlpD
MRRPRPARAAMAVVSTVLSACLLGSVAAPGAADPADRKREVDAGIADLQEALEGTSAELVAAAVSLQQTQARLPAARAELEAAQSAVAEARARDAELASRLAAANESEAKAARDPESGREQIDETHRTLGRIASAAYRGGTLSPGLAIALSAKSPADFADSYVMVDTALRNQNGALARLGEQQALRANAEARLQAVRDEVNQLRREAAANLAAARRAEAEAAARKAEVDRLLARQQEALAVIEARKASEMARLDQLEAERTSLEAELRRIDEQRRREAAEAEARRRAAEQQRSDAAQGGGSAVQRPGGTLSYPVNARISSQYGYRIHPIYGTRRLHAGTDFAAACGTPVHAAAGGSVVRAGAAGGYGNQVVVHHGTLRGESVATSYNHLQRFAARGGSVSRGEVVGYVGTTGTSTGCHLHFEVYVNGTTTNPMGWL